MSGRRGFIKAAAAGLAGAFLSLRGAQPVEAQTSSLIKLYRVPGVFRVDVFPTILNNLGDRLSAIDTYWIDAGRFADDGGPPLEEPVARAEWIALKKEQIRVSAREALSTLRVNQAVARSVRLRNGELVHVAYACQQYPDGIRGEYYERIDFLWKSYTGVVSMKDVGGRLTDIEAQILEFERNIADPVFPEPK